MAIKHETAAKTGKERRKYPRLPCSIPIRYADADGRTYEARTVDVSPFGMLVDSPTAFHNESLLKLGVDLGDGSSPIDVTCIVTRSKQEGKRHHVSVAFVNLTFDAFVRLKNFVDPRLTGPDGR